MPLTTPDFILLRIKVVVCGDVFIRLTDSPTELPIQRIAIVQDNRISDCTPYLRTQGPVNI
jgi:hypothetical protein